jgi:hypothetical protein
MKAFCVGNRIAGRANSHKTASRLEVTPVTAIPLALSHTRVMERLVDEAQYVLATLYRMRDEVSANPELFDPGARERIDEAIARIHAVFCSAGSDLMTEQEVKAA